MKKKKLIIIPVILAVLLAASVFIYNKNVFHLNINDEQISEEEYLDIMNQQINDVNQYFYEKKAVSLNRDTWNQEIEGEVPYEVLADRTLEKLKYISAVYQTAKENNYIEETGYTALKQRMEDENKLRAQKKDKGEPIYGLTSFSLRLYMEYEMDFLQKQYCQDPNNEGMQLTKEEQNQYYEDNKEKYFVKEDDITLEYIKVPYELEELSEEKTADLKNKMISLYKSMNDDTSLYSLSGKDKDIKSYIQKQEIKSGEVSAYAKMIPDVLEYAATLNEGESTQVIDENGCLYLIQCTDRISNDFYSLSEVKDVINKSVREQKYETLLEEKASQAKIDGDMKRIYFFTKKHINQ